MGEYIAVLKKYAVFKGRAGRKEFWMFMLISFVISMILSFIDGMISDTGATLLSSLYLLAVLLPSLAVGARRLHDTDKTAWLLLLLLIPIVGWIALIVMYAMAGTAGQNKFGAPAKPVMAKKA